VGTGKYHRIGVVGKDVDVTISLEVIRKKAARKSGSLQTRRTRHTKSFLRHVGKIRHRIIAFFCAGCRENSTQRIGP
jgi:hypothetical protein